jgi:hypothetical protein
MSLVYIWLPPYYTLNIEPTLDDIKKILHFQKNRKCSVVLSVKDDNKR